MRPEQPAKPSLPVEMKTAEPLKLLPPERHQRVTVAQVIGPEATREAVDEERAITEGTQQIGPRVRRRTRADDLLTEEEGKELQAEIASDLAAKARLGAARAKRWRRF